MIQSDSRPFNFLGLPPEYSSFEKSKVVILPVSYQSTNTPHEIILDSRNVELYNEDLGKEIYKIGIHTLAEMTDASIEELYKISQQIIQAGKFQVTLGDDPAIHSPLMKAQLEKWPSMKVLQIDARSMHQVHKDNEWFVKVVDELPEHVYFSIDTSGMNPDELTWRDLMNLIRELTYRRNVIAIDLVGHALQQGQALYCAKLLYKILGLVFNNITRPLN